MKNKLFGIQSSNKNFQNSQTELQNKINNIQKSQTELSYKDLKDIHSTVLLQLDSFSKKSNLQKDRSLSLKNNNKANIGDPKSFDYNLQFVYK